MSNCLLILASILLLFAIPAFATDGVMPETENPAPPRDRLVDTPMTCMIPPFPSIMLDNSETPMDLVKLGAVRMSDYVQDLAIYMKCVGNKTKIIATNMYERFMASARAQTKPAPADPQNPGN